MPSRLAPTFTKSIWSRPWIEELMCSERVSVHLTARPSLREAHEARISSGYSVIFTPKPPPTSGAITRTRSSDISIWPAMNRRIRCGFWLVRCSVSWSPR